MSFPFWVWFIPVIGGLAVYVFVDIKLDKIKSITIRIKKKGGST